MIVVLDPVTTASLVTVDVAVEAGGALADGATSPLETVPEGGFAFPLDGGEALGVAEPGDISATLSAAGVCDKVGLLDVASGNGFPAMLVSPVTDRTRTDAVVMEIQVSVELALPVATIPVDVRVGLDTGIGPPLPEAWRLRAFSF